MKSKREQSIHYRIPGSTILRSRIVHFVGLAVIVVVSFFLGNLLGNWTIEKGFVPADIIRKIRISDNRKQSGITPSPQQSAGLSKPVRIGNREIDQPGPDASPDELTAFTEAIREVEKEVSEVTVGDDCALSPQVIRVQIGKRIAIVNSTSVPYTFVFGNNDATLILQQQNSTPFEASLMGTGIYSIMCQDEQVGFLRIVE